MSEHGDGTRNPMKEVRRVLNLTQEQMAERLHCSTTSVRRWEQMGPLPQRNQIALAELRQMARQTGIENENAPTGPWPTTNTVSALTMVLITVVNWL